MINSDQVNYIVWRYLSESGFEHAAFSLKNEMRNAETLDQAWATRVPTGHLVDSLQRALMFEECMAQIDENGEQKDPAEVQPTGLIPASGKTDTRVETNGSSAKRKIDTAPKSVPERKRRSPPPPVVSTPVNGTLDTPMRDPSPPRPTGPPVKVMDGVTYCEGHSAGLDQVFWHPTNPNLLATTSVDGTARIWNLASRPNEPPTHTVLACTPSRTPDKSVTAFAWNIMGNFAATGSYDGTIRIFSVTGAKQHRDLLFHSGPIFALKYSRGGEFILSACADGHVGVWNATMGSLQQRWDLKSAVMDVEWISNALFLSSCQDGSLKMWQLGRDMQVKQFNGHKAEICTLKWNSNINLGATGGHDKEVKIWRADSEKPTQILAKHKKHVHAIEWAPRNQGDYRILASASRDGLVCIWDVVRGELLHSFAHDRPILAISFSSENVLACAGEQGEITIWDIVQGRMLAQSNSTEGQIYNIKFSTNGDRIAAAGQAHRGAVYSVPALN